MSVRVTGILHYPLGDPAPNTQIRFTTVEGEDTVLTTAVQIYVTDDNGNYDFNILYGRHQIEVLWTDTWECIGEVLANAGSSNPSTIQDLIDDSPIPLLPPNQGIDSGWDDRYGDVCSSVDSVSSKEHEQVREGNAVDSDIQSTYSNPRLCSDLAEHIKYASTSNDVAAYESGRAFEDVTGFESADHIRTNKITGGLIEEAEIVAKTSNNEYDACRDRNSSTPNTSSSDCLVHTDRSITTSITYTCTHCTPNSSDITSRKLDEAKLGGIHITGSRYVGSVYSSDSLQIQREHTHNSVQVNYPKYTKKASYCDISSTSVCISENEIARRINIAAIDYSKTNTAIVGNHCNVITNTVTESGSCIRFDTECLQICDLVCFDTVNNQVNFLGSVIFNTQDNANIFAKPDRVYDEYAYSPDGLGTPDTSGDWSFTMRTGDEWRTNRCVVECGVDSITYCGAWSTPACFGSQDGLDGDLAYYDYEYSVDGISNWHQPMITGDKYRRERTVIGGVAGLWSTPALIAGIDGLNGKSVAIEYMYSIDATLPDPLWHCNFDTGDYWRRERHFELCTNGTCVTPHFFQNIFKLNPEKGTDYVDGKDGVNGADGEQGAGSYIWYKGNLTVSQQDLENFVIAYVGTAVKGAIVKVCDGVNEASTTDVQFYIREGDTVASWTSFTNVIHGNALIDGTLAASALIAQSITGDQISATLNLTVGTFDPNTPNAKQDILTISGNPTDSYSLWAGALNPSYATTSITKDGVFTTKDGVFYGTVFATDGEFTGTIDGANITGGYISGAVIEASMIIGGADLKLPTSADTGANPRFLCLGTEIVARLIKGILDAGWRIHEFLVGNEQSKIAAYNWTGSGLDYLDPNDLSITAHLPYTRFKFPTISDITLDLSADGWNTSVTIQWQGQNANGDWVTIATDTLSKSATLSVVNISVSNGDRVYRFNHYRSSYSYSCNCDKLGCSTCTGYNNHTSISIQLGAILKNYSNFGALRLRINSDVWTVTGNVTKEEG